MHLRGLTKLKEQAEGSSIGAVAVSGIYLLTCYKCMTYIIVLSLPHYRPIFAATRKFHTHQINHAF